MPRPPRDDDRADAGDARPRERECRRGDEEGERAAHERADDRRGGGLGQHPAPDGAPAGAARDEEGRFAFAPTREREGDHGDDDRADREQHGDRDGQCGARARRSGEGASEGRAESAVV